VFEIPGNPVAKKRPRFTVRGKHAYAYSDQASEEGLWIVQAMEKCKGLFPHPLSGPIDIKLFFLIKRPKGHFGTGKNSEMLKDSAPREHTCKPDVDNMIKFVLDCLNHCGVWRDDCQIVGIEAVKWWTYPGDEKTEIQINF
jgi:Holliday junction resolvase RusA-like endonuclease